MKLQNISKYYFRMFLIVSLTVITLISNITMTVHATEEISILEGMGTITSDSLNVRSGPGKEYDVIGKVYDSDNLKIIGTINNWYRINYNGSEGYVSADYVTLEENQKEEISSVEQQETVPAETEADDVTEFQISDYKIQIIVGSIILIVIIILITLKGIRRLDEDDDEEDDEYDEDDEDDDEYDEDEYEEEDDEYEEERYIRKKPRRQQEMIHLKGQQNRNTKQQTRTSQKAPQRASQRTSPNGKELDLILSNNPDDYRIDIDPIYFEEDKKETYRQNGASTRDEDLKKAMRKMEELQREIDRLKNQR